MNGQKQENLTSVTDKIALMAIYRDEWKYRDQTFSSYFWRFVFLSLVITFLPDFFAKINFQSDIMRWFPKWFFPMTGLLCSLLGVYLGYAENQRIESIDEVYKRLAKTFVGIHRVEEYKTLHLKIRLNLLLCVVVYSITITLAIINLWIALA